MNIRTYNLCIEKVSLCCYTNAYRLFKPWSFPQKIRYEITQEVRIWCQKEHKEISIHFSILHHHHPHWHEARVASFSLFSLSQTFPIETRFSIHTKWEGERFSINSRSQSPLHILHSDIVYVCYRQALTENKSKTFLGKIIIVSSIF